MQSRFLFGLAVLFGSACPLLAQANDPVRLVENFRKDAQYHVNCHVEIVGTMPVPAEKGQANPTLLPVTGKSVLKYDERISRLTPEGKIDRTVRFYKQMEFERKVGKDEQHSRLRPEVQRLVILRHNHYEVPFSPSGPLTWGEIDLVRTDVFVPALGGLFPDKPVRIGDRWNAGTTSIQELTDLDKIEQHNIVCTFKEITMLLGRRNAHVTFEGKVLGVGEDGNASHDLRGSYYVDLDANFMTYLYVKGTHHLLGKNGLPAGKIEGTFILTRTPSPQTRELMDDALRGLTLEPSPDNTRLLFDQPHLGVRFLYPREWRVTGANDRQIAIDNNRGSGVLLTLSRGDTPTPAQFFQETLTYLAKQNAKPDRIEKPRALEGGIDTFSVEGEVGKQQVILQYHTIRQGTRGATSVAHIVPQERIQVQRDVDMIIRSFQISAPK